MLSDHCGLDREDGDVVDAAARASKAALETAPLVLARAGDRGRRFVDEGVELLDPFAGGGHSGGWYTRPVRDETALRVSVLELPARWDGARAGLAEVDALLAEAETDLAVLPELALTGYVSPEGDFDVRRFAEPIDGPTVRAAAAVAARHRVHLMLPLVLEEGGRFYNATVVLTPAGEVAATYRKRHPWFPEMWATPGGREPPVVRICGVRVTMATCFDGHFLARDGARALRGADLLAFTSAWVDEEDSRMPLLRSLARAFRIAVANANWGPGVVEVPGQGGSCILDERGETIALARPGSSVRIDAIVRPRTGEPFKLDGAG
jgi:predicted amidohydrolase